MCSPRHRLIGALAGLALLVGCGGDDPAPKAELQGGFDAARAFADLREQVELGPRPSGSRANEQLTHLLASKLREAGVGDVGVQRPLRNVVGVIPGSQPGYVVIGAHHDTKNGIPGFVGANDGASGVAVVLELARSLPRPLPGPSIAIALFDGEEARGDRPFEVDGKRGSTQYVELAERGGGQETPPLEEIEAMVLYDMVGDCDLAVPYEPISDPALYGLFSEADPATFSGRTFPIDDDHAPFVDRDVPAVDLIDFDYGAGPPPGDLWHTPGDTLEQVCPESLEAVGEASLEALPGIR